MLKKCLVLHEEVIDVFHEKYDIPKIEKLSFHIACVRFLGSMEFEKTRNDCFHANASKNGIKLKQYYAEKFSKKNSIEI